MFFLLFACARIPPMAVVDLQFDGCTQKSGSLVECLERMRPTTAGYWLVVWVSGLPLDQVERFVRGFDEPLFACTAFRRAAGVSSSAPRREDLQSPCVRRVLEDAGLMEQVSSGSDRWSVLVSRQRKPWKSAKKIKLNRHLEDER